MIFPNHARPRNLAFTFPPGMRPKLAEMGAKPSAIYPVRVTARVPDLAAAAGSQLRVAVEKIEFPDPRDGHALKTIE